MAKSQVVHNRRYIDYVDVVVVWRLMNLPPTATAVLSASLSRTPLHQCITSQTLNRESLASAFSVLRRVRPRVPFFQLAAHRIPTKWSLYRELLRCLPNGNSRYQRFYGVNAAEWDGRVHGQAILWWIRRTFREQRNVTSPQTCRGHLLFWHKLLDMLQLAPKEMRERKILSRYESLLAARKERLEMEIMYERELAWIHRMRNRPIMSGGYLRPSINNKPLPRFYRQPIHITMMIRNRVTARTRRLERQTELSEWVDAVKKEHTFQTSLWEQGAYETENQPDHMLPYGTGTKSVLDTIARSFDLEKERASSFFPPEMIATIKRARTFKIENKTRERQRERRGEITSRLLKRMNQGPPAHVLTKMSDEERHIDRVVREVSMGGYSGKIKMEEKAKRRSLTFSTRENSSAVPGRGK